MLSLSSVLCVCGPWFSPSCRNALSCSSTTDLQARFFCDCVEKKGEPRERTLIVDRDSSVMSWGEGPSKVIDLNDVTRILIGKTSPVFRQAPGVDEGLCFSVVARDRSLDFQTKSAGDRDRLVKLLRSVTQES